MVDRDNQYKYKSFDDWKVRAYNATSDITSGWSCLRKYPYISIVLGIIILVTCCCTIILRNKIANCFKKLRGKDKYKRKGYNEDVEMGKRPWKKKKKSKSRTNVKTQQKQQVQNTVDFGVQNSVSSAPKFAVESSTSGCYKCYKKKKRHRRIRR